MQESDESWWRRNLQQLVNNSVPLGMHVLDGNWWLDQVQQLQLESSFSELLITDGYWWKSRVQLLLASSSQEVLNLQVTGMQVTQAWQWWYSQVAKLLETFDLLGMQESDESWWRRNLQQLLNNSVNLVMQVFDGNWWLGQVQQLLGSSFSDGYWWYSQVKHLLASSTQPVTGAGQWWYNEVQKLLVIFVLQEMLVEIRPSWWNFLKEEFIKPYFIELSTFVHEERHKPGIAVYPPANLVFNWTRFCDVLNVKAVILGQDPYPKQGKAQGLSFSVPYGFPCPRSLLAIYKELETDIYGFTRPGHGTLIGWAEQGVLLLNTYLTVRGGQPNSHTGWMTFTRAVISKLIVHRSGIVFMLLGTEAQNMEALIDGDPNVFQHKSKHLFLSEAAHPAARAPNNLVNLIPFPGCQYFSKCNNYLEYPIDWNYLPKY